MITKAYILGKISNSTYKVRIPIFERDVAEREIPTYEATLSYNPGTLDSYREGDVVYVSFEDNDYANVVIIGKLYQGNESQATSYQSAQSLNVAGETELTNETYINGVNINDIFLKQADFNNYVTKIVPSITYRILQDYDD